MDELVKLNKEGTTIVMVTHDAKVASQCNRVLFIVDGNIKGEYTELSNDTDHIYIFQNGLKSSLYVLIICVLLLERYVLCECMVSFS